MLRRALRDPIPVHMANGSFQVSRSELSSVARESCRGNERVSSRTRCSRNRPTPTSQCQWRSAQP